MRRTVIATLLITAAVLTGAGGRVTSDAQSMSQSMSPPLSQPLSQPSAPSPMPAAGEHPSVLVIVLDDATVADVARMPNVQQLIADEGTTFERTYSPDPICCPARATILTGDYPHNHRVLDNAWP